MYRTAAGVQHKMAVHLLKQKAAALEIVLVLQRMAASLGILHFLSVLPEQARPWQQGVNDQRHHHIPLTEWQQPKDKKASFSSVKIVHRTSTSKSIGTLQRTNTENSKQIFPEKEMRGNIPNFHIHVPVSDLYIPTNDLPILLQEICGLILGIFKSLTDTRMWKSGLRPRNSQKRNT
jgi:hypothetical protein